MSLVTRFDTFLNKWTLGRFEKGRFVILASWPAI